MVNLRRFRQRQITQLYEIDKPSRERHYLSILGSVLSIVLLVMALSLKEWAKAEDDSCSFIFSLTKVYVFDKIIDVHSEFGLSRFYKTEHQILISCILSVTVLTILSSAVATIISAGYPREKMEFLRHYSVFNVVSLLCIVLVAGLWLGVVHGLPHGNLDHEIHCVYSKLDVNFGYCYYILLVGGLFSLGGASFNLLFARTAAERRRANRLRFREQQQNRDGTLLLPPRDAPTPIINRDLRHHGSVPPPYSVLENETEETTETAMNELDPPSEQDEPTSPPPPYTL